MISFPALANESGNQALRTRTLSPGMTELGKKAHTLTIHLDGECRQGHLSLEQEQDRPAQLSPTESAHLVLGWLCLIFN
jgi:hypothetical protein